MRTKPTMKMNQVDKFVPILGPPPPPPPLYCRALNAQMLFFGSGQLRSFSPNLDQVTMAMAWEDDELKPIKKLLNQIRQFRPVVGFKVKSQNYLRTVFLQFVHLVYVTHPE